MSLSPDPFRIINIHDLSVENNEEGYFLKQPLEIKCNYELILPDNVKIKAVPETKELKEGPCYFRVYTEKKKGNLYSTWF